MKRDVLDGYGGVVSVCVFVLMIWSAAGGLKYGTLQLCQTLTGSRGER